MIDNKVTRSIRADAETIERFKALSEQFDNQGECLESLIRAYEMDKAKIIEGEMKPDIRSFESHTNGLYGLYISSIEKIGDLKNKNTKLEEHIKELLKKITVYENMINGQDIMNGDEEHTADGEENAAEKIENYREISRIKNIGVLYAKTRDLTAENKRYQTENTKLSEKISELTQKNGELTAEISTLQAQLKIKDSQFEYEMIKTLNEKESQYLKKLSDLMDVKDKLANELYELKKNL
ncbi:MAG: hypothetical protein K5979_06080 [Ruminococcus sp.]|nr:hypothetical protein [Ruminococcus sp.]